MTFADKGTKIVWLWSADLALSVVHTEFIPAWRKDRILTL